MVIVILHAILVTAIVVLGKSGSLISVWILGAKDNHNLTPAMFVPTLKRGALSYFSRLTHTHTHLTLSLWFGRSQRGCLYPFNIQILTISFVKGKDLCNTCRPCVRIRHALLWGLGQLSQLWDDPDGTRALGPPQEDTAFLWPPYGTLTSGSDGASQSRLVPAGDAGSPDPHTINAHLRTKAPVWGSTCCLGPFACTTSKGKCSE